MQFDLNKNLGYFEKDENTGLNERIALGFPLDWPSVNIDDLYRQLRHRRIELDAHAHNQKPDHRALEIIQMIDADLFSKRPDLYEH